MNKIIVSRKILADAYTQVFLNLEKMNYTTSEKLLNFVEENNYPVERDMVDYARVIIYSNSERGLEALKLSEQMLERGLQTTEMEMIVNDVHQQLLKQKEFNQKREDKLAKITKQKVYELLEVVKPTASKLDNFIDVFSNDQSDKEQFYKFFETGEFKSDDTSLIRYLKTVCAKILFIEDTYRAAKVVNGKEQAALYKVLDKSILTSYSPNDCIMFLYFHKKNLIKNILIDEKVSARTRSFLAYQLDSLFSSNLIGHIQVKMLIGKAIYQESISKLNDDFNKEIEKYSESLEKFFDNTNLNEEDVSEFLLQFQRLISYTYPTINPLSFDSDKFIASFLFVISNNNYNSKFNVIIEDVYNLNQDAVKTEMEMIEILILI